jgi:hypothetical protein
MVPFEWSWELHSEVGAEKEETSLIRVLLLLLVLLFILLGLMFILSTATPEQRGLAADGKRGVLLLSCDIGGRRDVRFGVEY